MEKDNKVISIDEAYDRLLNSSPEDIQKNKLSDEEVESIAKAIDETATESNALLNAAKEEAANSDLKDTASLVTVNINPVSGVAMGVEDFDPSNDSIKSFEELLEENDIPNMTEMDMDIFITKYAIASFFAIDTDALENNGITDEVVKKVNEVVERFELSKKTGKKFSYYNAMPDIIKEKITMYNGPQQAMMTSAIGKEGRNYIAAALMNAIIDVNVGDALQNDLNKSIASMNKELSQDNMWGETRRYFSEELPELIVKLKEANSLEQAERAEKVIESFNQACTYDELFNEIKSGKLKYRHIDLEDFPKACKNFNSQYEKSNNVITDVAQIYPALCRNTNLTGNPDLYKEFICLFMAYCKKHNFKADNIIEHTYMYYFIQNIITLEYYNPDNEKDVEFHDQLVNNINRITDYLSQKDPDSIQE